jgi:hypothetical protein
MGWKIDIAWPVLTVETFLCLLPLERAGYPSLQCSNALLAALNCWYAELWCNLLWQAPTLHLASKCVDDVGWLYDLTQCVLRKADPGIILQREFGRCVWDPQLSIHAGETPRHKRHPCWSCLIHNLCFNTGFNQQFFGHLLRFFISGKPVDISMYFMSRCQHTSKLK